MITTKMQQPDPRTLIGATVETQLADSLEQLLLGDIELHHLTPALSGWYMAGFENGRQCALRPEMERLTWERDAWYFVANNRGKTIGDFYGHLTSELWAEASR